MAIVFGYNPVLFHIIQHTLRSMTPHSFFYTDINGQKQGPFNTQQLQTLAARGAIMPNTSLEREDGRQGFAHQISGLNFNVPIPVPPPVPAFAQPPVTPTMQASESDAMGMEMLLLIILSIVLGGLCVMKLVGLPWIVFVPMSIITIVALMFFWDRKKGNELKDRANRGDAQAMYDLALRHQWRNQPNEATLYLKQAAENGHADAQYKLGCCYMMGDSVEEDDVKAFNYFEKAAINGSDKAGVYKNLADVQYKMALDRQKDPVRAMPWFQKAADREHVDAMYELGCCYARGYGDAKKNNQAFAWLKKAVALGHTEARDVILFVEPVDWATYKPRFTDIFKAVGQGRVEDVRYFIEKRGNDVNARSNDGYEFTPLHIAATCNSRVEVLKYLIFQGVGVNTKEKSGTTALYGAVMAGNVEFVRFLVSAKADVNVKDKDEYLTPLHLAAKKDLVEISEILISAGADVNAKTSNSSTPLHLAAVHGNVGIAIVLVSNGADVNAQSRTRISDGTLVKATPLDLAKAKGHIEIAQFLSSAGGQSRI